jgi:hypothetical protein
MNRSTLFWQQMRQRPSYEPTSKLDALVSNRRARIVCGVLVGALAGALAAYYLPLLWWYYANGLSDTSGGPEGVEPMPVLAPFGALVGAGVAGWTMADRIEQRSKKREPAVGRVGRLDARTPTREDPVAPELARRDENPPTGMHDPPRGSGPSRDRVPLVVLPVTLLVLVIAGVASVYGLANLTSHGSAEHGDGPATAPVESTTSQAQAAAYAGLTGDRAAKFAAADFAKLLGISDSDEQGGAVATIGRELDRTRCFHSRHWRPYWRVSFAGGSPIFESKPYALVFCNRNSRIIEVSAPIRH